MKAKYFLLIAGLAIGVLVLSGCYTQVARPDREDESRLSRESEVAEQDSEATSEASETEEYAKARRSDEEDETNVYIYGGWYGPYWYPWYRYPYSRFYVSIGFGYHDPLSWCGTPWDWWYDPWCADWYYAGYWRPSYYGWQRVYYDPYFYYPRYVYRDRMREHKSRDLNRRNIDKTIRDIPGTYGTSRTSGRGTLTKPISTTYARGEDGAYRRIKRNIATTVSRQNPRGDETDRSVRIPANQGNDGGRRTTKGQIIDKTQKAPIDSRRATGESEVLIHKNNKPAPPADFGSGSKNSGSSGSSGSGKTISKPSGSGSNSSGGRSTSKSSGQSSSKSGSSSNRRSKN